MGSVSLLELSWRPPSGIPSCPSTGTNAVIRRPSMAGPATNATLQGRSILSQLQQTAPLRSTLPWAYTSGKMPAQAPRYNNVGANPMHERWLWERHACRGRRRSLSSGSIHVSAALSRQERLQDAARQLVDSFVKSYSVIGLGSGPGSAMVIDIIGSRLREGILKDIQGVPMSSWSAAEAAKAGIPLTPFDPKQKLEMAFDDADLLQEGTLFAIVGRPGVIGRESIVQEKAVGRAAKEFILLADETEFVENLIGELPVLIKQEDWLETAEEIDDLFLGDAEVWRRPTMGEAGPMGGDFPLVTQEGYFVLDVLFTSPIEDAEEVARSLESIPGVVEHGLFLELASAATIAGEDGVKIRTSLFRKAFTKKL